jgi:hypothetical protein
MSTPDTYNLCFQLTIAKELIATIRRYSLGLEVKVLEQQHHHQQDLTESVIREKLMILERVDALYHHNLFENHWLLSYAIKTLHYFYKCVAIVEQINIIWTFFAAQQGKKHEF